MNAETEILGSKKHFKLKDKKFVLALLTIDGVGRVTAKNIIYLLIKHELNFEQFWVNKMGIWQKCKLSNKTVENIKKVRNEHKNYSLYNQIKKQDIRVIAFWEKDYPPLLKQCDDFPLILFAIGNIDCLTNDSIGVVGTRRITSYGRMATKKIVEDLVLEDFAIVSGFMYGVDLQAHLEAIENGGTTIAVLGFGFNHMYPQSHERYFNRIIESGGCFITEYFPDVRPVAGNFPTRNRIVAGMSKAVVVIEAASKSGSHITAECAINEGREVFAVPGPINNPFSEGTKWLLNQGATLITSGNDVVAELKNCSRIPDCDQSMNSLDETQKMIVEKLRGGPQTLEALMESLINVEKSDSDTKKSSLNAANILKEVTSLELSDLIKVKDNILYLKL